ncbi:UNVERIFIED_CONTAM: hypothetical protein Sangu_1699400 [Sesamum angustifolium]|uniref:Uncharacterized protein n=1 Tax=Sesamum angustifolium TaxID=2727405 RepID=A0AAW2ML87_9LAMI
MVMLPPTASPKVTAGFKWPPEMLAAIDTPTNSANAWPPPPPPGPVDPEPHRRSACLHHETPGA